MNKRAFWTSEDLQIVRWLYPHVKTAKIAQLLGRRDSAVYQAAAKMGLEKSEEYLASPDACRLRRSDNPGVAFRFPRGHVPANKGLRRPGWSPGRMRETQFKKGERTGIAARNWMPVGTRRKDSEGFWRIKVREAVHGTEPTGFGNVRVWPLLNRYVWAQHHGAIPPSHAIAFKDGNRDNCDIENLELVSRADMARRNSMWARYPRELAEAIQLNGALKRKLRRSNREKQDDGSAQPPVRNAGSAEG